MIDETALIIIFFVGIIGGIFFGIVISITYFNMFKLIKEMGILIKDLKKEKK